MMMKLSIARLSNLSASMQQRQDAHKGRFAPELISLSLGSTALYDALAYKTR